MINKLLLFARKLLVKKTLQKNIIPIAVITLIIAGLASIYLLSAQPEAESAIAKSNTTESLDKQKRQPEKTEAPAATQPEPVIQDSIADNEQLINTPEVVPVTAFIEGSHYITKFPNEQPNNKVIVEFFSYMCQHCYNFEHTLSRWIQQKPDDIELLRVPVTFGRDQWELTAKAFYIAEELGLVDEFSPLMFRTIHIEQNIPQNEADLAKLFATLGISSRKFNNATKSFNVDSKMRKADFLTRKYKVNHVPYFLINFKYEAGKASLESDKSLFRLWNNLPAKDF